MKKIFYGVILPVLVSFFIFTGCPEPGTNINDTDNSAALINSVWAGFTPRAGDWLTITFKPDGKVICSFSFDNTSNEWEYTFNTSNTGTISTPEGVWNPAPNGFTISVNTLTITNYGSHSGLPREFKCVRQADLSVDPVPFPLEALDANLLHSVWAGVTPRAGDWLTITFRPENKVIWSFSFDNSTNEWEYSFNSETQTGTITVSEGWNPAPNGFTINAETLTITNYGSHGGASREFKRYR